jgi:hypothetical protein
MKRPFMCFVHHSSDQMELARQYWQLSVAAHHAGATRMKCDGMDEHFAAIEQIAMAQRPELWDGSEV